MVAIRPNDDISELAKRPRARGLAEPRWAHPPANLHTDVAQQAAPAIRRPSPEGYPESHMPATTHPPRRDGPSRSNESGCSDAAKPLGPAAHAANRMGGTFPRPIPAANLPRPCFPPLGAECIRSGREPSELFFPRDPDRFVLKGTDAASARRLERSATLPLPCGRSPDKLLQSEWGGSDPSTKGNARMSRAAELPNIFPRLERPLLPPNSTPGIRL